MYESGRQCSRAYRKTGTEQANASEAVAITIRATAVAVRRAFEARFDVPFEGENANPRAAIWELTGWRGMADLTVAANGV